jgi:hypothetical protein
MACHYNFLDVAPCSLVGDYELKETAACILYLEDEEGGVLRNVDKKL